MGEQRAPKATEPTEEEEGEEVDETGVEAKDIELVMTQVGTVFDPAGIEALGLVKVHFLFLLYILESYLPGLTKQKRTWGIVDVCICLVFVCKQVSFVFCVQAVFIRVITNC